MIKNYDKIFWWALLISVIYFYYKGWTYAQIGSYLPLSVILIFSSLAVHSYFFWKRGFIPVIKTWGLFLLLWSIAFFAIELLFQFFDKVTEAHIRNQFTLGRNLLSICFLYLGYYALFRLKRTNQKQLSD